MQVKNNPGKAAKGMSQAEFCDNMKEMVTEIGVRLHDKLPTEKARHVEETLLFSYDNAAFHECPQRLLEVAGIHPSQRAPLPPWAPDFNQPIEHAHGRFKQRMFAKVDEGWWPSNMDECWATCKDVWEEVNAGDVVGKNVDRLLDLYNHVAVESKGNWAPKALS